MSAYNSEKNVHKSQFSSVHTSSTKSACAHSTHSSTHNSTPAPQLVLYVFLVLGELNPGFLAMHAGTLSRDAIPKPLYVGMCVWDRDSVN